ncbi:metallophosphoesterase family protein [Rhizobium sp. C4]|uniref:metallophosphoesterase family protein n=1 Tax=Rhizobium sp. C4 TaxID=1349800 RepID=UPI001E3737DB|nr:metallophosphoesterase [Rhizobium sp. C4]MCD2175352.1 metallophosphoesterase [Rhizobium sp. C4]
MPTLIHLSDLHRSPQEPIDNDTLLAAIAADIDRFAASHEWPDGLIVSGDLVQGVRLGVANFDREMRDQYAGAFDLIQRLCEELLGGDRSKVAVVPGNHDICWNTSRAASEEIADVSYPRDLRQELGRRESALRWSWAERKLYKIIDDDTYADRLGRYWDAVEAFYSGVALPLPIDRRRGFNLFELFGGRMLLAGFETTHRNDHLRYEADLTPGVIGRCALHLRKNGLKPDLLAAVWHHSVNGPPSKEDYLSIENIREMAGLGFQMGFHGHQHLAESTDLSVSIGGGATMSVISSGSLCAGWTDLPRGTNRQYNIVRFDQAFESGSLHVREMAEGNQFEPKRNGRFVDGMVPITWSPRLNVAGLITDAADKQLRAITVAVDDHNRQGRKSDMTSTLLHMKPKPATYPRWVLLQALKISEDWESLWGTFWPTDDADEAAGAAEAAYQLKDITKLDLVLSSGKLPAVYRDTFEVRRNLLKMSEKP